MTEIQSGVLVIPLAIRVFSWVVLLLMLGGLAILGDRTPGDILLAGLTVAFAGIIILVRTNKQSNQRVILFLGFLGFISLCYMVFKDIFFFSDYIGAILKSFIFVLFSYALFQSIKCIWGQYKN